MVVEVGWFLLLSAGLLIGWLLKPPSRTGGCWSTAASGMVFLAKIIDGPNGQLIVLEGLLSGTNLTVAVPGYGKATEGITKRTHFGGPGSLAEDAWYGW